MALTSQLIHGFAGSLLSKRYDNAVPTPQFHLDLWDLCCSEHPLVAIAAPRGHAKSTCVSHAYVLAAALFRDRRFILLVSDTETQAVNFLNDIKQELKDNEDLIELFGVKGFKKETETDIVVEMQDGHTFRILVRGAEQRVRGLKWNQLRPDLIVCDDMENEELVYNKERREKFKKWFEGALLPCRAKHGIVRVVGTVMHLDSLLNKLLPEDSAKSTRIEPLKSYSVARKPYWLSVRYRAHNEDFSEILWPEMYDREFFEAKRNHLIEQGIGEIYAQEYLNYPIDESTAYFKRNDFLEIMDLDLKAIKYKDKNVNYYIGVDLAVSLEERTDYSAFVVVAVDDSGIVNVVDVKRERLDGIGIIEELFSLYQRYKPEWFVMEKGVIKSSLWAFIKVEMIKRGMYLNFIFKTANKDKYMRARSIQARMRAGGVKFDKTADWFSDLQDEMIRFPKARNDDQVDALAWIGLALDEVREAQTTSELEEEEYQGLIRENAEQGRSWATGY